ncbi:MAG: hypothetical protein JW885_07490 [Deltaproteobacteria bacterium]|nr:hypothetical protein [Candidatus Zymogenaceae bacterium]
MRSMVIIHGIEDAIHCVENTLYTDNILVSTHPSVEVFLKEMYGVDCMSLSSFLRTEECFAFKEKATALIDEIVLNLDTHISPLINSPLDLKMNWFTARYQYRVKHQCLSYMCFIHSLRMGIERHNVDYIKSYKYVCNSLMDTSSDISYILEIFFENHEFTTIENEYSPAGNENRSFRAFAATLRSNIIEYLRHIGGIKSGRKKTLFCDLIYNLHFLKDTLPEKYNMLTLRDVQDEMDNKKVRSLLKNGVNYNSLLDFEKCYRSPEFAQLEGLILKDIKEDFICNSDVFLGTALAMRELHKKHPISLGISGLPRVDKVGAIAFEYLRSENIDVVIGQHGYSYGELYNTWHFDLDFDLCSYFFSYGFTFDDLQRLYPERNVTCEIVPIGYNSPLRRTPREEIDLLFPMTFSSSFFHGGFNKILPHLLLERQIALLEFLDSLKDLNIVVKPLAGSNFDNCAVLPVLKRLKNIRTIQDVTLTRFLEKYKPRAVLVEFPSTPLIEVIGLDTEIFFMGDDMFPYDGKILEMLRKRVYFFSDVKDVTEHIERFFQGKLEKKRDTEYCSNYLRTENVKENALRKIEKIIE